MTQEFDPSENDLLLNVLDEDGGCMTAVRVEESVELSQADLENMGYAGFGYSVSSAICGWTVKEVYIFLNENRSCRVGIMEASGEDVRDADDVISAIDVELSAMEYSNLTDLHHFWDREFTGFTLYTEISRGEYEELRKMWFRETDGTGSCLWNHLKDSEKLVIPGPK